MNRFFNLLLAMLAVWGIACTPEGTENDVEVTGTTFDIEVTDITETSAVVKVRPSDNTTYYYYDVVKRSIFEEFDTDAEFASSRIEMIREWAAANGSSFVEGLVRGADEFNCGFLTGNTDYYAYAFGITIDGEQSTDVAIEPFTTLAYSDERSDNTFTISISDITAHGATINVATSNDDTYYFYAVEKAEYDAFESDEAFANSMAAKIFEEKYPTSMLSSGDDSFIFNALLKPNTDYYAYAFGLSGNGMPTTNVTKELFKTEEAVDNTTVLNYFTSCLCSKNANYYVEGVTTWMIAFFAQDETNNLILELQTPDTATDIVGEYEFASTYAPNTAVVGTYNDNILAGSFWLLMDNFSNIVTRKLITSGSVNISKSGNTYNISIDALDQDGEKLTLEYTGTPNYL